MHPRDHALERARQRVLAASRVASGVILTAAALLPLHAYFETPASLAARAVVAGLALLSLVHPVSGLLGCAALAPLGGPLGGVLGSPPLVEPLALAFLTGWLARWTFSRPVPLGVRSRVAVTSALLFAVAAVASSAVRLLVQQPGIDFPWPFTLRVLRVLTVRYFIDYEPFGTLVDAWEVAEGVGLFVASVVLSQGRGGVAKRLLTAAACGAAGVASLNAVRFIAAIVASNDAWAACRYYLTHVRISTAFPDPNAAGSYLAMALFLWAGVCCLPGWRHTLAVLPGTTVALALWLTGSRAALLAVVPAVALAALSLVWHRRRLVVAGVLLTALATGLLLPLLLLRLNPAGGPIRRASFAFDHRIAMIETSLRMFAIAPVFGIGHGRYAGASSTFLDPAFRVFGERQNAHNNFLQVLAELGLAGFVPFVWLLGMVAWRVVGALRAPPFRPVLACAAGGMTAFVATWLAGHPLLIREVALTFWLVLGAIAALAAETADEVAPPSEAARRRGRRVVLVGLAVAVVVMASVGWRSRDLLSRSNLEGTTIGLSEWRTDEGGVACRVLSSPGQIHVPATATFLRLPVRLDRAGASSADLEVGTGGPAATRTRLQGYEWQAVRIVLPRDRVNRRFRPVVLRVVPSVGARPVVLLGTPQAGLFVQPSGAAGVR